MPALCLTAAKRSAVVHVISTDPAVGAGFTACGRRIGDDWQGEYTEAPAGPVTCKGKCGDVAAARQAELEAAAIFRTGERVGILTGYQAKGGKTVGSYGRVVRIIEGWNGKPAYVVQDDDGRFVFEAWQLVAGTTNGAAREAINRPTVYATPDGLPPIGHPEWKARARAASMAAHPAGKALGGVDRLTGEVVHVIGTLPPVPPTMTEQVLTLLHTSMWDVRPVAPLNTYTPSITYRHQG